MDMSMHYPKTCPYDGDCDRCGYFEERKPTKYLTRQLALLKEIDKDD